VNDAIKVSKALSKLNRVKILKVLRRRGMYIEK